jgi:hypothetical protein
MIEIYLDVTLNYMFNTLGLETEVAEIINKSIVKEVNSLRYFILK